MKIVTNIKAMQALTTELRARRKQIGFVPTMGALHSGHAALLRACRNENDIAVLSIFVNPIQFGPREDFRRYPRDKKNDVLLAKNENVDIIFLPSADEMYSGRYLTYVEVEKLTEPLCGKSRPGHFRGVATVVTKLLNIVQPHLLYMGQKDAQQWIVVKKMLADLNSPVKVKVCPTVRDNDGLALSSRNRNLSPRERAQAVVLYQSLCAAASMIRKGERMSTRICRIIKEKIEAESSGKIEYVSCSDVNTLLPLRTVAGGVLIALAVRFGQTRLIDNIILNVKR